MERTKSLETAVAISGGLLVCYLIFEKIWLVQIALGIIVIAIFVPRLMSLISMGWMKLAEGMGFIMSKVLLSFVFFIFLTPIALIQRLVTNNNALQLKHKKGESLFFERNYTYTPKDLKNPW